MKEDLLHLSRSEMLSLWRGRRLLQPDIPTAQLGSVYPADFDTMLLAEIDAWYRSYLLTAPLSSLQTVDMAARVMSRVVDGLLEVTLPEGAVRVAAVRAEGWKRDGRIITQPSAAHLARQSCRFTRSGASMPVALHEGMTLTLCPAASGRIETLDLIMLSPGQYHFAPGALSSLRPIADMEEIF